MLMAALQTEVEEYVRQFAGERDELGHALVVRNGTARERRVTMGAGTIEVRVRIPPIVITQIAHRDHRRSEATRTMATTNQVG